MVMIEVRESECVKRGIGVQRKQITFCGIPIYEKEATTTNIGVIRQLASVKTSDAAADSNVAPKMGF